MDRKKLMLRVFFFLDCYYILQVPQACLCKNSINIFKPELKIQGKMFVYRIQVMTTPETHHIRLILLRKIRRTVPTASQIFVRTLVALYRARKRSTIWPPNLFMVSTQKQARTENILLYKNLIFSLL